jgi:hypothetical protein
MLLGILRWGGAGAGFGEECGEGGELGGREVAEGLFVEVGEGLVELCEEGEACGRDFDVDDSAVFVATRTLSEALVFESVDEACDVGDLGDHGAADGGAGRAEVGGGAGLGLEGAAEDSEDVVRGFGEVVLAEEVGEVGGEGRGGADDVEVGLLLGEGEGCAFADLAGEAWEWGGPREGRGCWVGRCEHGCCCNRYRSDEGFGIKD